VHATGLGGPVYWLLLVILFGSGLLAFYVIFDSFRSARAERLAGNARIVWVGPQVVYAAAFVASLIPAVPSQVRFMTMAAAPLAIILQVSYLLKVAHPKAEDGTEPGTHEGDAHA
jgi:uncharacterized membrane protein